MAKAALLIFSIFISFQVSSEVVSDSLNERFYRISVAAEKGILKVARKSDYISIRTLDVLLGKQLKDDFEKLKVQSKYIKDISVTKNQIDNFTEIKIQLKNIDVEAYNFYRDREKSYVIDFWNDSTNDEKLSAAKSKVKAPKKETKVVTKKPVTKTKKVTKVKKRVEPKKSVFEERPFLDFRYGAAFIWDYDPLLPSLKSEIKLDTKTPEYYFQVKDREIDKNDAEAHLQLIINLYRDEKYGLMYRAIKLFREKHGQSFGSDVTEYLQANALLKENLKKGNREPVKPAIKMLENVGLKTKDYQLKKGILKYLGIYFSDMGDHISALSNAKRLYVVSKENFDYEESKVAAEQILYYIAKLNQIDDLEKLANDKTMKKLLPIQSLLAYKFYVLLKQGKTEQVLRNYNKVKKSLVSPVHEGVLFNLAEALFREGKYDESIQKFDEFLKFYSYHKNADAARVRLALSYEILEKDYAQTAELYKNAINRASNKKTQYEAKVRLVGLQVIRKKETTEADKELEVLLTRKSNENFSLGGELEQLLWLVRLRTYIKKEDYDKALSYLRAIPVDSIIQSKKRTFLADGAEIISGLILRKFLDGKSHIVVRLWEVYSKRYFDTVAIDPYINYVVGKSYLDLGFYDSFEKLMARFERFKSLPTRTYPRWKSNSQLRNIDEFISLLKLEKNIKLKNWDEAASINNKELKKYDLYEFYQGVIQYRMGKYTESIESLENFVTTKGNIKLDETQQSDFYEAYTESLHLTGKVSKFQKVVSTIIQQKSLSKNDNLAVRVFERAYYLYLENLNILGSKEDFLKLEANSQKFLTEFQKSSYIDKVKYLLGLAYVKNLKDEDARKVFNEILNDDATSKSIKELTKTELTLMNLRKKKI